MEKRNKIILFVTIIITLIVVGLCIYSIINKNNKESDAIKFRNEYMELNDKTSSYGIANVNVSIIEDNTVKYLTEEEAVELLEEGTGIIYFGFSECPWCRNLVPILTDLAGEKEETIYYLNILDIRSTFKVEDGKLSKTRDGSKAYYKILDLLDEQLEDFYLTDEEGEKYDTEEKRLYAPTLVAVKDGKVKKIHVGTVDSQKSPYDELTDKQIKEMKKIITNLINSKNEEICTKDGC